MSYRAFSHWLLVPLALLLLAAPARALPLDLSVAVEGGVSRWTGPLGSAVRPGAAWGLRADARVARWASVGFSYSGCLNRLEGLANGESPLLVRDGANVLGRFSTGAPVLELYLEIGVGWGRIGFARGQAGPEYRGDSFGEVPVALGLMLHAGAVDVGLKAGGIALLGNEAYRGGGHLVTGALTLGASF